MMCRQVIEGVARSSGSRRARCGLCRAVVPVSSLVEGRCGACRVQPTLPLRDEHGRFFTFTGTAGAARVGGVM